MGKFFLGLGRLNQIHQHDRPFIDTPYIHEHVFNDSEGALDTGAEISVLIPTSFYLDVTVGATNGYTYGHSHDVGEKPVKPTHYVHLKSFFRLAGIDFQPTLSYLSRVDSEKNEQTLKGFSLTGKKREGRTLNFLLENEIWHRTYLPSQTKKKEETFGFYFYPQRKFKYRLD